MGSYFRGKRAWSVAASIGVVETLKDQGFCRLDYAIKVVQQHTKNNLRSYTTQAKKMSSSATAMATRQETTNRLKESEDSLRKVMYLSCWAPN